MPRGIGHGDLASPFGIQEIVECLRQIARLDHVGIVQNADRQHPPWGDHAVFFLELGRELRGRRRNVFLKQPLVAHDQLNAAISFDDIEARFAGAPFGQRAL